MVRKTAILVLLVAVGASLVGWLGIGGSRNLGEVLELLDAGVGEDVIEAHIKAKGMTFELSARDIARLKKAGASDGLIKFMISGGTGDFPFEIGDDLFIGNPITHRHLAVYPVYKNTDLEGGDYMSLDEAQRARVIVITERGGGSVPTVIIKNKGRRPIYIVAGEIIIGGKQDRMISHDVLIPAHEEIEVSVRCVEQGRWRGKTPAFKSGGALGSRGVRAALQFKAQQDVWAEVSKACEEHEAFSESGTYRTILSSDDVDERSKPFLDALNRGLRGDDIVGVVMALNGEVVCVDIFASPKFFARVKEKLLKAYVLDAIGTAERSTLPPDKGKIILFFDELKDAEREGLSKYGANTNTRLESDELIGSESRDEEGLLQHLNLYRR
jgi:hypothetical protein